MTVLGLPTLSGHKALLCEYVSVRSSVLSGPWCVALLGTFLDVLCFLLPMYDEE